MSLEIETTYSANGKAFKTMQEALIEAVTSIIKDARTIMAAKGFDQDEVTLLKSKLTELINTLP